MGTSSAVLRFFPNTLKGGERSKYVSTLDWRIVFPDRELEKVIESNNWVNNFSIKVEYLVKPTVIIAFLPEDFDFNNPWKIVVLPKKDPISFPVGALVDLPNFASSLEKLGFSNNPVDIFDYLESLFRERKFRWVRFFYSLDELTLFAQRVLVRLENNKQDGWEFVEIADKVIKNDNGESFKKRRTDVILAADFLAEMQRDEVKTIALFSGDTDYFPSCDLWLGQNRYHDVINDERGLVIVSSQGLISVELREIANNPQCSLFFIENIVNDIGGTQLQLSL